MNCVRESEVLEAIGAGRELPPELESHKAACADCSELALVAAAFHADLETATHTHEVPASGVVWWRIQRRERQLAMKEATRAITLVQTASILGAIAVALTILGGLSVLTETGRTLVAQFAAEFSGLINLRDLFRIESLDPKHPAVLVVIFGIFASVGLGSLAIWWAVREE